MPKVANFILLWTAACFGICCGGSLKTLQTSPMCGDWTPYKDEKCLKIADKAGFQTQADAEVICRAYADEVNAESVPKLITTKTKEEQDFMAQFLFVENEVVDNVWLGLIKNRSTQSFEWNDGSELSFSNWANESLADDEHECVQMESGDGTLASGVWLRVSCKRKNIIVCERRPSWTLATLQNAFIDFKLVHERKVKELEQKQQETEEKQKETEKRQKETEQEMTTLKQNPVPMGFIYTQLPGQDSPTILWPANEWKEITSSYSGLFFRAAGGQASEFGQIQEETSPRLKQVGSSNAQTGNAVSNYNPLSIPTDGRWSEFIETASTGPQSDYYYYLKFQYSTDEIRPRNQAVKLWQRIR